MRQRKQFCSIYYDIRVKLEIEYAKLAIDMYIHTYLGRVLRCHFNRDVLYGLVILIEEVLEKQRNE